MFSFGTFFVNRVRLLRMFPVTITRRMFWYHFDMMTIVDYIVLSVIQLLFCAVVPRPQAHFQLLKCCWLKAGGGLVREISCLPS